MQIALAGDLAAPPPGAAPCAPVIRNKYPPMTAPAALQIDATYVAPEDLCVGLHVHLDLSWMQHPFPSSSFKIKSADQIATIQGLALGRIRCSPELSDEPCQGLDEQACPAPETVFTERGHDTMPGTDGQAPDAETAVQARTAQLAHRRAMLKSCERDLAQAARNFKSITRNVYAQPAQSRELAGELIHKLAGALLSDADVTLHLMAEKVGGEVVYHHALNVALLSMLLARAMKAPPALIPLIGLGALFHDIGKIDIPDRVWRKAEALTRAEQAWVQQHANGGVEIARKMGLPPEALLVIAQHHEMADGSGYPKKLKGHQISLLARIVAVANTYDNLCNPVNSGQSLTPHEALSAMYGLQRAKFDEKALITFVRCMGIYPPGTVVSLTDGATAMVVSVNSGQALKPVVLLHDPAVPKEAALMLDLEDMPGLSISRTLKASELDASVLAYLAPYGRMTCYLDAGSARAS